MSTVTTLSANFEIAIPSAICDAQGWRPGAELAFIPKGRGALLMPVPSRHELYGIARGSRAEGYRDRSDRS